MIQSNRVIDVRHDWDTLVMLRDSIGFMKAENPAFYTAAIQKEQTMYRNRINQARRRQYV